MIQISEQFLNKLSQDKAYQWAGKLATIQTQNMKEVCSYYYHILPFIISANEVQNIQIEKYNVKHGGFAAIHYGIFREEMVVIKEQEFRQICTSDYYISMLREISILLYCDYPNISKIMGVYFDLKSLKIWIIQERYFIDLFEALFEDKRLIPKKKLLIIQLLEALHYIHSFGLIHMDLKPKNIIFETSQLKKLLLLDFGVCKLYKLNHNTNIDALSYFYSSPEVNNTEKSIVTPKSDIFSFGIVLYEFATQKRAWKKYIGQGAIAIYNLIHSNFNFFEENEKTGNSELDQLILDCVQQDPNKRPSAKEALEKVKAIQF